MTFATALNISSRGMIETACYPGPVMLILILLHGVMPLASWGWTRLFFESGSPFAVGTVLVMMVPAAVLSIIWSSVVHGEPSLALSTVILDSLLSPLVLPASVWLILGQTVEFDSRRMMIGLAWMLVLPTLLGVLFHDLSRGSLGRNLLPLNGPLSKLCIVLIIAINVAAARPIITAHESSFLKLLVVLAGQSLFGFFLGLLAARVCRFQPERVRTMTYCVGLRNISAGIVVALRYFSPATALPVVLAILVQQPIAALFHRFFFRRERKIEDAPLIFQ